MSATSFHNGRVTLHNGDCLAVLDAMEANSVDSVVCDPPYHLTSIVKRFGGDAAAPARKGNGDNATGAYARASAGFMGKQWDGGDIAFRPETWAKVMRVLKPGGHLVAFSGTRTYHRMAVAIEDAGFEIRDMLSWLYGSGFPKSHDIAKAIDRAAGAMRQVIAEGAPVKRMIPGADQHKQGWEKTDGRVFTPSITAPATDDAAQWEGWGTALKPACEPVCFARKPLSEGTVAANVLKHGTGALHVDACRIGFESESDKAAAAQRSCRDQNENRHAYGQFTNGDASLGPYLANMDKGRWPANVIHDGSDEVVSGFPNTQSGYSDGTKSGVQQSVFGKYGAGTFNPTYGDAGSAARFFYSAKADADDRIKSKHPTVKPVDLMRWLVRLVTPPGGVVLDPFAGTGTTGAAAFYEGFRAVLIEREAEYVADITRRMGLLLAGPDEKARALTTPESADTLPLFGGAS